MATPVPRTASGPHSGVPVAYADAPPGTRCANPACRKVITEGAAIRSGIVRVRCRHCKQLNVITEVNHYVVVED